MKMLMKGNSLGKSRKGFTLIELLIVMVILAILAGIVIISIGGVIGRGQATAYNADREQMEAAVSEFMTRPTDPTYAHTIGQVPVVDWNTSVPAATWNDSPEVIPGENYYLVAICPLTVNAFPKGILKQVPATAHPSNLATNAGGANQEAYGADNVSCLDVVDGTGHYAWYTTDSGDVVSVCIGAECAHGIGGAEAGWMDGFQDIYP